MKIIDLTMPIHEGMPVYPGDPDIEIEQIQAERTHGWNMLRICMNTHDGTHVNVPLHAKKGSRSLDDYELSDFCGECLLYENERDIQPEKGIIFSQHDIDMHLAEKIASIGPRFVGLSSDFLIDEKVERYLLNRNIILFENLAGTKKLPKEFFFHGAPLKIRYGDGSPIRAYAVVD
jgi:kynurenine formamidase